MNLYLFGWPSQLGGADTKVAHLLQLLSRDLCITVVPNDPAQLADAFWTSRLGAWGVSCCSLAELPERLDGVALAICNGEFFSRGIYCEARRRGLRVVWSSEMMWHHPHEVDLIRAGAIDRLLYVSDIQRRKLNYESFCDVATRMTGNYVAIDEFPFVLRHSDSRVTVGRLSRADGDKYPEDFPVFYEALQLPDVCFRVMAWSEELTRKYAWHRFDHRWNLLPACAEPVPSFLASLDLFVYPLGHRFTESWGRSTVEAMLTGAIPILPDGHHFAELIEHGRSGVLCSDFGDYHDAVHLLARDPVIRHQMSRAARDRAVSLNDPARHRAVWLEALDV